MGWWARLKGGVAQAGGGQGDVDAADPEPWSGRRPAPAVGAAARYPATAEVPLPAALHVDAGQLMAEGDVLAVGARDVRQPEPGRHAWVVSIWYQVDPLQLRDGGRLSLLPDQVVGTLPPSCYFCEVPWSFTAMRERCPGEGRRR